MMGHEEKVNEICLAKFYWNTNVLKKKISTLISTWMLETNPWIVCTYIMKYYQNPNSIIQTIISTINSFLAYKSKEQNVKMLH